MDNKNYSEVTLENIGNGVVGDLFAREMGNVLANIADLNTSAKEKREINIKVIVVPNEEREIGFVEIKCQSKLPGAKAKAAMFDIVNQHGKQVAIQSNLQQQSLFGDEGMAGGALILAKMQR